MTEPYRGSRSSSYIEYTNVLFLKLFQQMPMFGTYYCGKYIWHDFCKSFSKKKKAFVED